MEMILTWVLLNACWFTGSATQVYYITPNHSNCSVENITQKPCYTLSQLIVGDVLSSSKDRSVELVFLSGTHLISKNQTLLVSNFSEVVMRPYSEKLKVMIQCQPKANLWSNLDFQLVTNVSLLSLNFTSCFLRFHSQEKKGPRLISITRCILQGSQSEYAVAIENSAYNVTISNCTFSNNSKGALQISNSNINGIQITDSFFQDNGNAHDPVEVSILDIAYTALVIRNSQFLNNTAGYAIMFVSFSSLVLNNSLLQDNNALSGTLSLGYSNANISFCHFVNNSGNAALAMKGDCDVPKSYISNSIFQGNINTNTFQSKGGAVHAEDNTRLSITSCCFHDNSAQYGGALYQANGNAECEIFNSTFTFNKAERDGGAIYSENFKTVYLLGGNASFNYASRNGGFAYFSNSELHIGAFEFNIRSNEASKGGAIYADKTNIVIYSTPDASPVFTLDNNSAKDSGGALHLVNAIIDIDEDYTLLFFINNAAAKKGGAIFISDKNCEDLPQCFLAITVPSSSTKKTPKLFSFINNTAPKGPVVYGGLLDRSFMQTSDRFPCIHYFKKFSKYDPTPFAVTSEAVRVCLCTHDIQVDCTTREKTLHGVYKGQTIHLLGAAVDQDNNPVQSLIKASYSELSAQLGKGESRKETDNKCSNLSYHVFTASTSATLTLQPEGYCEYANFSDVTNHVSVIPCPTGFESNDDRCGCDKRLAKFNITTCNIDTYSIESQKPVWVRYDQNYLKVHANCPLDHCQATLDTISLEYPDEQCANHRSGVICGACQDNYSIALGGSKCLQCTSYYTVIWLVPVFALAGIALVAFLFICNMTISHGTINGLIFYVNVVSITGLTSLQNCSVYPILSVFIAWVNLDLGVETCFYTGMDTYQKTWLQFAFPLYIWLLVGAVILACQCSARATKLFGRSSIAVLATLFLLSYSKILKTIITALNFTEVFQGRANDTSDSLVPHKVWAYDGNLEYLKGKHMPLFVVAMVFLVMLVLPYTLLLTFGQCLRSLPTERRCVPRCTRGTAFISIMDAYHAPYNKRHRYWTGLLLLTRCFLFLAFATSYTDDQLLSNMYITNLVVMTILALNILCVYKNFLKNLLEVCFLLNLGILSGTLYFLTGNGNSDETICISTSASISVSMVLFGGILVYHAYLQLYKTRCSSFFQGCLHGKWRTRQYAILEEESASQRYPTSSTVQLREDFLESDQN